MAYIVRWSLDSKITFHLVFFIKVLDKRLMLSIVCFNDVLQFLYIINDYFPIVHSGFKFLSYLNFLVHVLFVNQRTV